MNTSNKRRTCAVLGIALLLPGCAAFRQTATEVTVREPGARMLSAPRPVGPEANKHWPYAWLSESAYGKTDAALVERAAEQAKGLASAPCGDAASVLQAAGWEQWHGFPDDGLLQQISASHLRVEVWSQRATQSVVVAFGGTVFSSGKDWKSNLRWFLPAHKDEYTEIVEVFGPAFVAEFEKRAQAPDGAYLKAAKLVAVGHSLGGGLAQQFAYALPISTQVPRVSQVFAFDPSPVTGFFSVAPAIRDHNRVGLAIDRIYERGEILALVRSVLSFFVLPDAVDPQIRGVRYSLFYPANPVSGHSMMELACKLQAARHGPKP